MRRARQRLAGWRLGRGISPRVPVAGSGGEEPEDKFLFQQYAPLFTDGARHAQLGVWMIGPEARGLGVREGNGPILTNTSRFVPHVLL